jgi:hypothetical protein
VDRIGIVRYLDAASGQLAPESYRPRTGDRRGFRQSRNLLGKFLGPVDSGLPDPFPLGRVEGGEDLAAPAVQDRQPLAGRPRLDDSVGEGVEGAYPPRRQSEADAQTFGGGDPDAQAGEGPGPQPDREQVDRPPAAGGSRGALDLVQQPGCVQGPPLRGEPQLRLVQYLAVAPGAGDGVDRRGIEADDDQGFATR